MHLASETKQVSKFVPIESEDRRDVAPGHHESVPGTGRKGILESCRMTRHFDAWAGGGDAITERARHDPNLPSTHRATWRSQTGSKAKLGQGADGCLTETTGGSALAVAVSSRRTAWSSMR